MPAVLLSGAEPARILRERLRPLVGALQPRLAIVQIGTLVESEKYIRAKLHAAEEIGMETEHRRLPQNASAEDVFALISSLNDDRAITGYILQLPLPAHLTELQPAFFKAMAPAKDVDGLTAYNMGKLAIGTAYEHLVPATAMGVVRLLQQYDIAIAGSHAVVIGRSMLVGKPLGMMLLNRDATVTFCHSKTDDLARHTRDADIVVCAVGKPGILRSSMIRPGATVVDVGIRMTPDGLRGDVDADVADVAGALTPVPGGVGPMTVACLLANCVTAAARLRGDPAPVLE